MSFLRQSNRISQRCLLIADDLTGGADSGAQFAKRGLSTLLISVKEGAQIGFSKYASSDVLVINTEEKIINMLEMGSVSTKEEKNEGLD